MRPSPQFSLRERIPTTLNRETSVESFLSQRSRFRIDYYRCGKMALRDTLDIIAESPNSSGDTVVLPACVPSALVTAITDSGFQPRFHRMTPKLQPDLEDVNRTVDDSTLALIAINYFGFPQPKFDALRGFAAEAQIPLIDDNAQSSLSSTPSGQLLGTRGDLGFTSFRKTLPVPDGAGLFTERQKYAAARHPRSDVDRLPSRSDAKFALETVRSFIGRNNNAIRKTNIPDTPQDDLQPGYDSFGRDPTTIWEQAKGSMSPVTRRLLTVLDTESIIATRRRRYRECHSKYRDLNGSEPLFGSLKDGTVPHSYPLLVTDWKEFQQDLGKRSPPIRRWPPLPHSVAANSRYGTTHALASDLALLPLEKPM